MLFLSHSLYSDCSWGDQLCHTSLRIKQKASIASPVKTFFYCADWTSYHYSSFWAREREYHTSPGYEVEPSLGRRQQKHEREQNSKAKHQYSDSHTMQVMHPNASIPLSENTALPGHADNESSGTPISFRVQALLWPPARFILGGRCVNSAALVNNQPVYVLFQSVFNWEASKGSGSVFIFFFFARRG